MLLAIVFVPVAVRPGIAYYQPVMNICPEDEID